LGKCLILIGKEVEKQKADSDDNNQA